jgi:hypothetical protein
MNMNDLNSVEWGDTQGLQVFMLENALQHQLFKTTFSQKNILTPSYNLLDLEISNIDDWMLPHQTEHQFFAVNLGLSNPMNLLDMNWNDESQFYDWMEDHYSIHESIVKALGF